MVREFLPRSIIPRANHPEALLICSGAHADQGGSTCWIVCAALSSPLTSIPSRATRFPMPSFSGIRPNCHRRRVGLITSPPQAEEIVAKPSGPTWFSCRNCCATPTGQLYAARELSAELETFYQQFPAGLAIGEVMSWAEKHYMTKIA